MTKTMVKVQVRAADWFKRFRQSEFGQGATEYAGAIIIAAIIVVALLGVAQQFGQQIIQGIQKSITSIVSKAP